ncbi:MAG: tRNA/rRNA methyltransferase [Prolixibacteraceae bacterium]|nr:tRNA/rRNA methyltransferase [Prolixibacteraceae bacterium]MBN2774506.1 tRNA/rRNA methyltransferase [Prolixibacteraceae bacterium]
MEIIFILVEPSTPENIGAVARAIKTMGFGNLRLVNPADYLSAPSRWMAHASNEILENARVFKSFEEAVSDCDFIIGTSAKQRIIKNDYHPVSLLPEIIRKKGNSVQNVAIVFGREDSGLRNEELKQCDLITTVPLKTEFPSLNLAQAVMIYAYELSKLTFKNDKSSPELNQDGLKILKEKITDILLETGFKKDSAIFPRIMERLMLLQETDIHLLHSVCNNLQKHKN